MRNLLKIIKFIFFCFILNITSNVYSENITVASWGGAYTESQIKAYKNTYSDPRKINFVNYNGGLGDVRSQVESGNIKWDLIDVLPLDAITGCEEGLFQNISKYYDRFPKGPGNTNIINDMKLTGIKNPTKCCVPQIFWSYVVFYDPDAFRGGELPSTVSDFFNVKKFPGKRAINTWATGPIEMAALAAGINNKRVYRELSTKKGLDKAFRELNKIKNDVIFWSAGSQPLELISSGEAVMAIAYNGRIGAAVLAEGANYEYIWDSQVIDQEYLCMVKGTNNFKLALDFMSHASSPMSLAKASKYITYGPMRASSVDIIAGNDPWTDDGQYVLPHIPNTPEKLAIAVMVDHNQNFDFYRINEKYSNWMNN